MKKPLKLKRSYNGICKFSDSFKAAFKPRNLSVAAGAISMAVFGGYMVLGSAGSDNLLRDLMEFKSPFIKHVQAYGNKNPEKEHAHTPEIKVTNETKTKHTDSNHGQRSASTPAPGRSCDAVKRNRAHANRNREIAAENSRHEAVLKTMSQTVLSNSNKTREASQAHSEALSKIEDNYRSQLARLHCD